MRIYEPGCDQGAGWQPTPPARPPNRPTTPHQPSRSKGAILWLAAISLPPSLPPTSAAEDQPAQTPHTTRRAAERSLSRPPTAPARPSWKHPADFSATRAWPCSPDAPEVLRQGVIEAWARHSGVHPGVPPSVSAPPCSLEPASSRCCPRRLPARPSDPPPSPARCGRPPTVPATRSASGTAPTSPAPAEPSIRPSSPTDGTRRHRGTPGPEALSTPPAIRSSYTGPASATSAPTRSPPSLPALDRYGRSLKDLVNMAGLSESWWPVR
ncbi:hypothetical protein SAMN04489712_119113 [Thermomonospora echinospora]|uniref:Uncharacterized protein n=1 Tax=Thermomonospora echinospora TaxID=1992 RepID=A0A1H6DMG0_9ACTN|nr:hypothetical protein SAMN04489712_119113 [Thermomonospora echinospora]